MGLDLSHGYGSWSYSRYDEFITKVGGLYGAIPNKREIGVINIEDFTAPDNLMYGVLQDKRFLYPKGIVIPLCIVNLLEHANSNGYISVENCKLIYNELINKKTDFFDCDGIDGFDSSYRQFMISLEEAIYKNEDLVYC